MEEVKISSAKASEREDRLKKLQALLASGANPYPANCRRDRSLAQVSDSFPALSDSGEEISVAGRVRSLRAHGNLSFADLEDASGRFQMVFSKNELGAESYKDFSKLVDNGDFLEIKGKAFLTQKGEPSLMASAWKMLSKALRPIPDAWYGLKDEEERCRRRYLDMLLNPQTKDMVIKRSRFWKAMRDFLLAEGFLEVETPVLETMAGGADARPFVTHR